MPAVAIVGIGGVGCRVAHSLSLRNFDMILVDRDVVERSNISRQFLYGEENIGDAKVLVAKKKLGVERIDARFMDVNHKNIDFSGCDIVVDCTDNNETRLLINDYCMKNTLPWIYTGAFGESGAVKLFRPGDACFQCFSEGKYGESCHDADVSLDILDKVADTAVALIVQFLGGKEVDDKLIRFNGNDVQRLMIKKNPSCAACSGEYKYLSGKGMRKVVRMCGNKRYVIYAKKNLDLTLLHARLGGMVSEFALKTIDFLIFPYGRVVVDAESEAEARKKYDRMIGV